MAALGQESAPLYGRFNAGILRLEPLRYDEVAAFTENQPDYGRLERLLLYGVFGGTPRYHALLDPTRPLEEEITDLLLRPHGPLENEVRFLLGSQQIRDPAPYNAVLQAIAHGETQFGRIQNATGTERGALSFYLRTLLELGWIRRELPFGETSDRRALYQLADPFLAFWYRFIAPLSSEVQFADPLQVYRKRVAPYLADYMGLHVFEAICRQWLQKNALERWELSLREMGRYWSRDGRTEIDIMAEMADGTYLFGECKWSAQRPLGLNILADLQAKIAALPDPRYRQNPTYALFTAGSFTPEICALAAQPESRLYLVGPEYLLPSAHGTAQ